MKAINNFVQIVRVGLAEPHLPAQPAALMSRCDICVHQDETSPPTFDLYFRSRNLTN